MRIRLIHIIILASAILASAAGIYILDKKLRVYIPFDFESHLDALMANLPTEEDKFARDLENAFHEAFTRSNLNDTSFLMVNASIKDSTSETSVESLKTNPDFQKEFYIASTYKPLMITSIIKMLDIESLGFEIPFKFQFQKTKMREMASVIYEYNLRDTISDALIVNYFAQDFKGKDLTVDEIYQILITDKKYTEYKFTLKEIIKETVGPSSNWTVLLLRDYLTLNGYGTEKKAATAMENYINTFLVRNKIPGEFRFILSENAVKEKKFNTMRFYQLEFLYDSLYRNTFEIPAEIHEYMVSSMEFVPSNPTKSNQRHELKSIAKLNNISALIEEKSGYIGFDLAAAPGLDKIHGWDKLPKLKDKRLIIFNVSSYSRIHLQSGKFIDLVYAIASPTYLSLDPYYEELNDEYLSYKNNILDNLEKNVGEVLTKYSSIILSSKSE